MVADHAVLARKNPDALVATLLRSRSRQAREILAHLASAGTASTDQLVESARRRELARFGPDLDPKLAGRLAVVLALQGREPRIDDGLCLLDAVEQVHGMAGLHPRDQMTYLQLLIRRRHRDRAIRLLPQARMDDDVRDSLAADLANPFVFPSEALAEDPWLAKLATALQLSGGLTLQAGSGTPFDRLAAPGGRPVAGPMITVVTSAYNPDQSLVSAVRSLIAQTWQNWEALVVDDASTAPGADEVLRTVEGLDPRVRVIRKAVNGGTYRARNTAIMQAAGEFITCLDSDDWAHPERLQAGVEPMLTHPGIVATRSDGVRVTESLELGRPGYRPIFPAASSLMFRVHPVVQRIGFFDPVRKAADTEYARRIEAAFGRRVIDVERGALTVLRGGHDTLSADEFSAGWRHPARWSYKQSYSDRHRKMQEGSFAPFVAPEAPQQSYGIRRWFTSDDPSPAPAHLDVVVAGDWRRHGGPQISMLEEIEALLSAGLSVGVMHLEAMRFFTGRDQPLNEHIRGLLRTGRIVLVHPDDVISVDLLMLRYPPILQFPPAEPARIRPRSLLLMANQAPSERDGSDQRYVPTDVHRNAAAMFGTEPRWVPQSPAMRAILEPLLPGGVLADWDNPAVVDVTSWRRARVRPQGARPVVGRFSRDDAIKFPPDAEDLLLAYDLGPDIDVRMMGATEQVARLWKQSGRAPEDLPGTWTLLPHKAMEVQEFLAGVDIVVYLDHPGANESFGRAILESVASGVPVIASPKHEVNFGEALLYAEPRDVPRLVDLLLQDPRGAAKQVERADALVRRHWSREAFLARVRAELPTRPARPVAPATEPAGHVTLRDTGARNVVEVTNQSGSLRTYSRKLRRLADGELADSVTFVHTLAVEEVDGAARTVLEHHRPDEPSVSNELPDGIQAVVWREDGRWRVDAADGVRVDGDACGPQLVIALRQQRSMT